MHSCCTPSSKHTSIRTAQASTSPTISTESAVSVLLSGGVLTPRTPLESGVDGASVCTASSTVSFSSIALWIPVSFSSFSWGVAAVADAVVDLSL